MKLKKMGSQVLVVKDKETLYTLVVKEILDLSQKSIKARGMFTLALSGGTTPAGVYSLMASSTYRTQFAWKNIHFFFGDERFVPHDHPRSNFKMIDDVLFTKVKIPRANIHSVPTSQESALMSVALYEKELRNFYRLKMGQFPNFDLVLLGLGEDGHTASLFPGTAALKEKKRLVAAVTAKGIPEQRISITFPVINHGRNIYFVVSGAAKTAILQKVLSVKKARPILPSQMVCPVTGKLKWFVDQAALGKI